MAIAKFNFNKNLLSLSSSKNLEIAKNEWEVVAEAKLSTKRGLCICQHTIKNVHYLYNFTTKHAISAGAVCCKKFNVNTNKKCKNKMLLSLFSGYIGDHQYLDIIDIFEYSKNIEAEMLGKILKIREEIQGDYFKLTSLTSDIYELINRYKFNNLQDKYDEFSLEIKEQNRIMQEQIEQCRIEKDKKIQEKIEQDKIEEEKIHPYKIKFMQSQIKEICKGCIIAKQKGYQICYTCKMKNACKLLVNNCKKCDVANIKGFQKCFVCNEEQKRKANETWPDNWCNEV